MRCLLPSPLPLAANLHKRQKWNDKQAAQKFRPTPTRCTTALFSAMFISAEYKRWSLRSRRSKTNVCRGSCHYVILPLLVSTLRGIILVTLTSLAGTSVFVHRICHRQCRGLHGRHVWARWHCARLCRFARRRTCPRCLPARQNVPLPASRWHWQVRQTSSGIAWWRMTHCPRRCHHACRHDLRNLNRHSPEWLWCKTASPPQCGRYRKTLPFLCLSFAFGSAGDLWFRALLLIFAHQTVHPTKQMKISILFLLFAVLSVANMCTQKSNNVLYVMAHTYCAYSYSSEK